MPAGQYIYHFALAPLSCFMQLSRLKSVDLLYELIGFYAARQNIQRLKPITQHPQYP